MDRTFFLGNSQESTHPHALGSRGDLRRELLEAAGILIRQLDMAFDQRFVRLGAALCLVVLGFAGF